MKRLRAAERRPVNGAAPTTTARQSLTILAEQDGLGAAVARCREADEQRWAAFVTWLESQGLAGGIR